MQIAFASIFVHTNQNQLVTESLRSKSLLLAGESFPSRDKCSLLDSYRTESSNFNILRNHTDSATRILFPLAPDSEDSPREISPLSPATDNRRHPKQLLCINGDHHTSLSSLQVNSSLAHFLCHNTTPSITFKRCLSHTLISPCISEIQLHSRLHKASDESLHKRACAEPALISPGKASYEPHRRLPNASKTLLPESKEHS